MAKIGDVSLILKLLAGLVLGALLGFVANEAVMDVVVSLRHIFGQIIFFLVPLVIVGFITPAIVRLGQNASKILVVAVCLAYASSLGAALFSMGSGYLVIPHLSIAPDTETLRKLPEMVFRVMVESHEGDHVRVNLPISLVTAVLSTGGAANQNMKIGNFDLSSIDFNQLIALVKNGALGRLVEVDSAEGDHVVVEVS